MVSFVAGKCITAIAAGAAIFSVGTGLEYEHTKPIFEYVLNSMYSTDTQVVGATVAAAGLAGIVAKLIKGNSEESS